jgi:hypothetical protein
MPIGDNEVTARDEREQAARDRVAQYVDRYFAGQELTLMRTHNGLRIEGRCTVPTHRDPDKHAVIELDEIPGWADRWQWSPWVYCQDTNCPGPAKYEAQQREADAQRRREAQEAGRRAVWVAERKTRTCSVVVGLMPDDTAYVVVWTPTRRGYRTRLGEFERVFLLRRSDRAAILANLPPSVRADARHAVEALLPDYRWARERHSRRSA